MNMKSRLFALKSTDFHCLNGWNKSFFQSSWAALEFREKLHVYNLVEAFVTLVR